MLSAFAGNSHSLTSPITCTRLHMAVPEWPWTPEDGRSYKLLLDAAVNQKFPSPHSLLLFLKSS